MSKLEKLKLREVHVLNDEELKMTLMRHSYNSYDSEGIFCPDECSSDADCAKRLGIKTEDASCSEVACAKGLLGSYRKCFEMNIYQKVCKGKPLGSKCSVGNKSGVCSNSGGYANYCFLRGYGDGFYAGS